MIPSIMILPGIFLGLIVGIIISKRCKHDREIVREGPLTESGSCVGWYRKYECKKCKKVKNNKWL